MDVIINEVVSSVRLVDGAAAMDPRQMQVLVRAVLGAIEERDLKNQRRREETGIPDDGRGGLTGQGAY